MARSKHRQDPEAVGSPHLHRAGAATAGPSQLDVARMANVSQAAVSRAFTPGASVSPETRARILTAARALGYHPNAIARSLVTQRSNIIAIVMANMWNPFYTGVLAQFTELLQSKGYWVLLFKVREDDTVEDALLTAMEYQVDGIIITSATLSSRMAEECASHGVPVVLFNRYTLSSNVNAVWCDSIAGGRVIADALLDAGYARLAYLAGDPKTSTNRDRESGFVERLKERGCELFWRGQGDFTYESGIAMARAMLAGASRPDAAFCGNDLMAMATIDVAVQEFGLKVPDDLAVVGFDDIAPAAWPKYSLTTVRQPAERLVAATVDVIEQAIDDPGTERVLRTLAGELVVRSSAPLRAPVPPVAPRRRQR